MQNMFTVEQIQTAHAKVKSGADFPAYIKEIKALGVTHYEAYVADGHIDYHGRNDYTVKVPAKYEAMLINHDLKEEGFKAQLLAHQQGKTDYLTFIRMCADTGIEHWKINISNMTCSYYNLAGEEVLTEHIPQ